LFDLHKEIDGLREAELAHKFIGTTKRGIGPAYASKVLRRDGSCTCRAWHPASLGMSERSDSIMCLHPAC
jgi:hypothetical protein